MSVFVHANESINGEGDPDEQQLHPALKGFDFREYHALPVSCGLTDVLRELDM